MCKKIIYRYIYTYYGVWIRNELVEIEVKNEILIYECSFLKFLFKNVSDIVSDIRGVVR